MDRIRVTPKEIVNDSKDYAQLLESLLPLIDKVVRFVARRMRLREEDAQDLKSRVLVDLCKDDYALLRCFRKESSWSTYLGTLVSSRACDENRKQYGKFRPSRRAERMGAGASRYEMLRRQEGLSPDEAARKLQEKGFELSAREIDELEAKIGPRGPRKFESLDGLESLAAGGRSPEEIAREHESVVKARKIRSALRVGLAELSADEQLALRFRVDARKVPVRQIAELLGWGTEKEGFRRFEQIYAALKKRLSELGVEAEEVLAVLAEGWPEEGEEDLDKPLDDDPNKVQDDDDES